MIVQGVTFARIRRAAVFVALIGLGTGTRAIAQQPTGQSPPAGDATKVQLQAALQQLDHYRKLADDYGQLSRYRSADVLLRPPVAGEKRVIFFGDSITDGWNLDQYFPGKHYVNRGISGQTTPQMLVRFRQDVMDLNPAVVVVLAGTNDLAGNTGPESISQIEDNYATMAELCRVHNIKMVFSSVTPVSSYGTAGPAMLQGRPPSQIAELDAWLAQYSYLNGWVYLNYVPAMADERGMMKRELSKDGLHPNAAGYAVMAPLAQAAVDKALGTM